MSAPSPPPRGTTKICMQVGERRFTTTINTLTDQSAYFRALFASRGKNMPAELHFFLDLDGDVFTHILRYLRNRVFPVFYDNAKGHDHSLYAMLLGQARFLQIPQLEQWLTAKTYLEVITVTSMITEIEFNGLFVTKTGIDTKVEFCSHVRTRGYVCPRGIAGHMGKPENCGSKCNNARANYVDKNEDETSAAMFMTQAKIEFNQELCMQGTTSLS